MLCRTRLAWRKRIPLPDVRRESIFSPSGWAWVAVRFKNSCASLAEKSYSSTLRILPATLSARRNSIQAVADALSKAVWFNAANMVRRAWQLDLLTAEICSMMDNKSFSFKKQKNNACGTQRHAGRRMILKSASMGKLCRCGYRRSRNPAVVKRFKKLVRIPLQAGGRPAAAENE